VHSYEEELHGSARARAAAEAEEQRLGRRCSAHAAEVQALEAHAAGSSGLARAEVDAAGLRDVEHQCQAGEKRLDDMERWFYLQVEQTKSAVRFAATEFQEAQAVWEDRLRKEEALRHEAEDARREADLRAAEAQAAASEAQATLEALRALR